MTFGDYVLDTRGSKGHKIGSHSRFVKFTVLFSFWGYVPSLSQCSDFSVFRYYPGEWGHSRCRQHYTNSPIEKKRESFDVVCNHFSPSFRFFFVERFGHSLKDWYAAKMRYTRSVAVSSIVGHILGIGDRHTSNVLVSQLTGEFMEILVPVVTATQYVVVYTVG